MSLETKQQAIRSWDVSNVSKAEKNTISWYSNIFTEFYEGVCEGLWYLMIVQRSLIETQKSMVFELRGVPWSYRTWSRCTSTTSRRRNPMRISLISPTLIEYWDSMGYVMICHQKHNLILGVSKMGYTSKYTSGCWIAKMMISQWISGVAILMVLCNMDS